MTEPVRVVIKTAGRFRIAGDEEDTIGAVILFPDGPPPFPIGIIWDREILTLSRTAERDRLPQLPISEGDE